MALTDSMSPYSGLLTPEEQANASNNMWANIGLGLLARSGYQRTPQSTWANVGAAGLDAMKAQEQLIPQMFNARMTKLKLDQMQRLVPLQNALASQVMQQYVQPGLMNPPDASSPATPENAPPYFLADPNAAPQESPATQAQPQAGLMPNPGGPSGGTGLMSNIDPMFALGSLVNDGGEKLGQELQKQRDPLVTQFGIFNRGPGGAVGLAPGVTQGYSDIERAKAAYGPPVTVPMGNRNVVMSPLEFADWRNGLRSPQGSNPQGSPASGGAPQPAASNRYPAGLGVSESPVTTEYNKTLATNFANYEKGLNERVQQGSDLNMRLQESRKALENFRAGGGAETRAQLAQIAQAMNLPDKVVNGVAGGDLASMQEFKKLAVQQAMEQLKQSMSGSGRISQMEFKTFQDANPNLSTDPNAIDKVYNFANRVYNRDLSEQQELIGYRNNPNNNPVDFPAYWAQKQQALGYTNPNMKGGRGAAQSQSGARTVKFGDLK